MSLLLLCTEPEGYHFGAANGLGLAVWRNTADADDVIDPDESDADVDEIAFGFMTWQPNATLLHHTSQSTGDTLDITLVSLVLFFYFIDTSVICCCNA